MKIADMFDLRGRTAIVTGGSRGLGLRIAETLGEAGARIVIGSRRREELDAAGAHLRAQGIEASCHTVDMGQVDSVRAFADQALDDLGHCDILVNNAGASWAAPAAEHPLDAWQKLLNVNLTGVFVLTQEVGRRSMIPRRDGRILVIASIAGLSGNLPGTNHTIAYNTTKGGLVNFTRALAGEWGPLGITVNALAPGFFPSRMSRGALADIESTIAAATPLRRIGSDEDLQAAALLMCSPGGRHITGQVLAIDGGMTAL